MRFIVDLTDLLALMELNRVPMGVVRVQIALLEAGLQPDRPPLFELTAYSPEQARFVDFPVPLLLARIKSAREGGRRDDPAWVALGAATREARALGTPSVFAPGDRVLALGQTGNDPNSLRRLRELREAHRVLVCVLFHDAIPLSAPEHCSPELSRSYAEHFLALCLQIDRAVANSAYSAQDFRRWQRRLLPHLDIPVGVMPLDAHFAPLPDAEPAELPER